MNTSSNTPPTRDEVEQLALLRVRESAERRTTPPRDEDVDKAASVLAAWWLAGLADGIDPEAFDWTGDLAGTAYDAVALTRRRAERAETRRWIDTGSGPGWSPDLTHRNSDETPEEN